MRGRDVLILVVCAAATGLLWMQDGGISVHPGFLVKIPRNGQWQLPPKPIVDDFDGDGKPEFLYANTDSTVAIVPSHLVPARGYNDFFTRLDDSKTSPKLTGFVVGMGAGFLTFPGNLSSVDFAAKVSKLLKDADDNVAKQPHLKQRDLRGTPNWRKGFAQHIAVVTDDYFLHLLDKDLDVMWSVSMVDVSHSYTVPRHASVLVLPDRLYVGDSGVIVVSVLTKTMETMEKRTFMAFEGLTGKLRWRHSADDLSKPLSDALVDPEHFKMSEKQLKERSTGLVDWTKFRESMVATLPHAWSHLWHTTLVPHAFVNEKTAKKRSAKRSDGSTRPLSKDKKQGVATSSDDDEGRTVHDETVMEGAASLLLGAKSSSKWNMAGHRARNNHVRPLPNVIAAHHSHGVAILHLFTGRIITTLGPLLRENTYDDINDDFRVERIVTQFGADQRIFGKHGVDQVYVCHGTILSDAPTSSHVMSSHSICDSEGYLSSLGYLKQLVHGDAFHGAGDEIEQFKDVLSRVGSRNTANEKTQGVTPLVVHTRLPVRNNAFRVRRYAVFMINSGTVTAVSGGGVNRIAWRTDTPSIFDPSARNLGEVAALGTTQEQRDAQVLNHPHLFSYAFHDRFGADPTDVRNLHYQRHRHQSMVVAVGDAVMSFLSSTTGDLLREVPLYAPPVAPSIVADFNGDGVNDILLLTAEGYVGYAVARRTAASATSVMMFATLAALAVVVVSSRVWVEHDVDDPNETKVFVGKNPFTKVKRSTD